MLVTNAGRHANVGVGACCAHVLISLGAVVGLESVKAGHDQGAAGE